jgi:hypothetical protein
MSVAGQSLLVLCRSVGREVSFDPVTDLIPIPNPVATCRLRTRHDRRPSRFIRLARPTRMSLHSPCCSSRAAAYQRLLNSSSTAQPTFRPRDLSSSRRST